MRPAVFAKVGEPGQIQNAWPTRENSCSHHFRINPQGEVLEAPTPARIWGGTARPEMGLTDSKLG